jgi:hypothetical protein
MSKNNIVVLMLSILFITGFSLSAYFYTRNSQLEDQAQKVKVQVENSALESEKIRNELSQEKSKMETGDICKFLPLLLADIKLRDVYSLTKEKTSQEFCYLSFAFLKSDPNFCEKIESAEMSENCYFELSMYAKDASLCKKTDKPSNCYGALAFRYNTPDLCEKLTEKSERDSCFGEHSNPQLNSQSENTCERIEDSALRDNCYFSAARYVNNPALCEKVGKGFMRDTCYAFMVKEYGDKTLCEKIEYSQTKDLCLKIE